MKIEVWGEYALFTRPEFHSERVSYDVMTPSAARGLLEAILWHPGVSWIIDRIYVLNPIKFANIRTNEVSVCLNSSAVKRVLRGKDEVLCLSTADNIAQRSNRLLRNVRYVIEAHIELTPKAHSGDTAKKFTAMMRRRAEKGQFFHHPYFGIREYTAHFRPWPEDKEIQTAYPGRDIDLGLMLYDMDYSNPQNIQPMFFNATLHNGVLDLTKCEVIECS